MKLFYPIIIISCIFFLSGNAIAGLTAKQEKPAPWNGLHFHPGKSVQIMQSPHMQEGDQVIYNSSPPTSGPHREVSSQHKYNKKELPKEVQIHELEHGSIMLQYNCTNCKELIFKLARIASDYDLVLLAPYNEMNAKIAVTAWGKISLLDHLDEVEIRRFIIHYIHKGDPHSQCKGSLHRI